MVNNYDLTVLTNTGKTFPTSMYSEMAIESEHTDFYIKIIDSDVNEVINVFSNPVASNDLTIYHTVVDEATPILRVHGYSILKNYKIQHDGVFLRLVKPGNEE